LAGHEAWSTTCNSGSQGASSECPQCDSKMAETGYRRLRCPRCGFEAYRDVIGKLSIRKRALKTLGIKAIPRGVLTISLPPDGRCKPE